jgi:hypothetical protein
MIVMLSAVPGTPLRRPSDSVHACCEQNHLIMEMRPQPGSGAALSAPGTRLMAGHVPYGALERRATPAGQAHHDISPVDNAAPRVDDLTARSFFLTHPVDGITAGDEGAAGRSFGLVLSTIPRPRTGRAACLHRLSTDLCTERLDAGRGPQKTVRTGR